VFTSEKLTTDVETGMGAAILGAYDLDGDGKNELLLEGGGKGAGERAAIAKLVEFQKDTLETVEDLGEVYSDPCELALHDQPLTARVFYYLPPPKGQKARFTVEVYRAPCPVNGKDPQWTRAVSR
jgi:hypothetical protein